MSEDEKLNSDGDRYHYDGFFIKEFLDSIKHGNLQQTIEEIKKHSLDIRIIKDCIHHHNALFYATLIKDDTIAVNFMKYFVQQGIDPLYKDKMNQTVLYYAAREGRYHCCKFLIECGCPLNEKDVYQQTPLYYAARDGRLNVVELMVENGADIHNEDNVGQTCLFYAVREGQLSVVEYLIKRGVNVNKLDKKKHNALTFAYKYNREAVIDCLINNGALPAKEVYERDKKRLAKPKKELSFTSQSSNVKEIDHINLKNKVVLVRILDNGSKRVCTLGEIEEFRKMNPNVYAMLTDPYYLEKLEREASDEFRVPECWEKIAKKILNLLWKYRDAEIFLKPVDPVELGIPDYFDIVKEPMDFSTIKVRSDMIEEEAKSQHLHEVQRIYG